MKPLYNFLLLIFTLFLCLPITSQNSNYLLDSSFNYLSNSYYKFKSIDSLKSKKYAKLYLEKASVQNDTINSLNGYYYLSEVLDDEAIYLNYIDRIIYATKDKPSKDFPARAYYEKARYFFHNDKEDESLKNYLLVLKSAKKIQNDSLTFLSKEHISVLEFKINNLDKLSSYLKILDYYNQKNIKNDEYFSTLLNISGNYTHKKKYDSASYYNNKAYSFAIENEDFIDLIGYVHYRQGQIAFKRKKYRAAIDSLQKAIPDLKNDENYSLLSSSYLIMAKSFSKQNEKWNEIKYYLKIDSLHDKTKIINTSVKESTTKLTAYYKEKKDLQNQLKYIEKLLIIDSTLNARGIKFNETLYEEFEKPKLLAEKELVINELEESKSASNKVKFILISIAIFAVLIIGYQYKKRKTLKKRFLILQKENKLKTIDSAKKTSNNLSISKDIISNVLQKLEIFEKKKEFTNLKLTLHSLAKESNTNANYLSKIVNHYKEMNFPAYLNELRINYALELLKENKIIRKYTIKAIANEVGFNTAESFSNAFYKKTGLKPSYYIQELNKRKK